MELQGKVIAVLPEKTGISARGEWRLASYVIETQEQYPKKLAFDVFGGDKIANFGIQLGEVINVSFDIDAHEYNGRYFNQVRAWNVVRPGQQQPPQGGYQQGGQQWGANNPAAGAQSAQQAQQQAMRSAVPNGQPAPQTPPPADDADSLPF